MPANFQWEDAKTAVNVAAQTALRAIGQQLYARRLHRNLSQQEVADAIAGVTQVDVSQLEQGTLPASMRAGNDRLESLLRAIEWRNEDIDDMVRVIKEFARWEMWNT